METEKDSMKKPSYEALEDELENKNQSQSDSLLKEEFLDQLPKKLIWNSRVLHQWEGFWYSAEVVQGIRNFQSNFEPRSDDILLASSMKTGTTWLKAICVSIMGIQNKDPNGGVQDPDELQLKNPHECVRTLEYDLYFDTSNPDFSGMKSPRLFHTHLSYSALPDSVKNSDCKIVYITRNPKDTFVSLWHYLNKVLATISEPYPIEKFYDEFREGFHYFGSNLDHVLQYWSESLMMPNKILFLKYEDLKKDPKGEVKRLASFIGRPFVNEDEVDKVLWRSSLDRLKNLEVNKNGAVFHSKIPNSSFFRRGVIGDWKNYLTAEMEEGLDELTQIKLEGSGLKFGRD